MKLYSKFVVLINIQQTVKHIYIMNINTIKCAAITALVALGVNSASAQSEGCYGASVFQVSQGQTKINTPVNAERSFPENALGAPNGQNPPIFSNTQFFFSLGFGGSIVIQFEQPIANGDGADIRIWESSASPNQEKATILVSQNGINFIEVGQIQQTGEIDFGDVFSDYINFVKIQDSSSPANFGNSQISDGYDVDAVECLHGAYLISNPNACYADSVVSFNQKKQNDGSTINESRSNPEKALGAPQDNDTENFVSLGFGGDITLRFASPIKNGEGADVRVIETTFGSMSNNCNRYPETIRAFASQDNCNWVWLGDDCQDAEFDLGSLAWAQYIKLVDISNVNAPYQGTPIADAYDVDAVMCLNGFEENPLPAVLTQGASQVISYTQGTRKNGTPITAARTMAENALGVPQGNDVVNFVSLGFGGQLILKFPYVIFDNPLAPDLQVVETTFGGLTCAQYPETADIEGSLDGENWIHLGTICLDDVVDITSAGVIQYIRITDRTPATSFNGSADGYDVDGVVVINQECNGVTPARVGDNTNTPDEVISMELFPNPAKEVATLVLTTGSDESSIMVTVNNYLGQSVIAERLNVASSSVVNHNLSLDGLKPGVYFVTVESKSTREVIKLIKN
jgi:hypothetical protein